jgi:DNA-3-methyladenine glycosylase II
VSRFTIEPQGAFDLAAAASFGFGPNAAGAHEKTMRLAFCVDGGEHLAAVTLRQDPDEAGDGAGAVHGEIVGDADPEVVRAQVARILSLDHDGTGFAAAGERDPVLGRLQRAHPGQRPVLFHSPYEAAAWGVIAQRRAVAQASVTRRELAERHGETFHLEGETLHAFPTPARLATIEPMKGLPAVKVERLHGIAHAALEGRLDANELRARDPDEAREQLLALPGIGPFYASLILIRATGHADLLPAEEPRTQKAAAHYYGLDHPPTPDEFERLAEPWRPFRTWAAVLLQLSGRREGVI